LGGRGGGVLRLGLGAWRMDASCAICTSAHLHERVSHGTERTFVTVASFCFFEASSPVTEWWRLGLATGLVGRARSFRVSRGFVVLLLLFRGLRHVIDKDANGTNVVNVANDAKLAN
jgi:hypothetical protein